MSASEWMLEMLLQATCLQNIFFYYHAKREEEKFQYKERGKYVFDHLKLFKINNVINEKALGKNAETETR